MEKESISIKTIVWLLVFIIIVYSVLDTYQTKLLLDCGASEINPFLKWLMDITGTWLAIPFVKTVWIILLITALKIKMHKKNKIKIEINKNKL